MVRDLRAPAAHLTVEDPTAASVLATVLTRGPVARNAVAAHRGLSPATVSKALRAALEARPRPCRCGENGCARCLTTPGPGATAAVDISHLFTNAGNTR